MRVVFYLQRKKKYLLPLFQNSHFEMSRSWFQSSGESSWVYIQDLQACSSLQEIDIGTSRFRSEHDFSNMISLIFFYPNMVFMVICFHCDRFREVYDSLHAPYQIQGQEMEKSRCSHQLVH